MPKRTCVNGHVTKDDRALKCSQCGADLPPAPKRSRLPLILGILGVLGVLFICGVLAVAMGGNKDKATTTSPPAATEPTDDSTKAPGATQPTVIVRETVAVTVRQTVVVTAPPSPVLTATPKPESKLGYELGPVVTGRGDRLWFMSQITNTGTVPLGNTKMVISLKDDGGKVLDVVTGSSDLYAIMPGQSVPVVAIASDEPKGWTKYDARATAEEASNSLMRAYDSKLELTQATMTQDGDRYRVAGEVKNIGDKTVMIAAILVGLYDQDGQLVGFLTGYGEIQKLQPGDSSPFSVKRIYTIRPATTYKAWLWGPVEQ